jgi:Fe-S-cluster containining protein
MDCKGCGKCCVLTDDPFLDVQLFERDYVPWHMAEYRGMKKWMKRKPNGECIALDEKKECSIYSLRPMECRDFNQDHPLCKTLTQEDTMRPL